MVGQKAGTVMVVAQLGGFLLLGWQRGRDVDVNDEAHRLRHDKRRDHEPVAVCSVGDSAPCRDNTS